MDSIVEKLHSNVEYIFNKHHYRKNNNIVLSNIVRQIHILEFNYGIDRQELYEIFWNKILLDEDLIVKCSGIGFCLSYINNELRNYLRKKSYQYPWKAGKDYKSKQGIDENSWKKLRGDMMDRGVRYDINFTDFENMGDRSYDYLEQTNQEDLLAIKQAIEYLEDSIGVVDTKVLLGEMSQKAGAEYGKIEYRKYCRYIVTQRKNFAEWLKLNDYEAKLIDLIIGSADDNS